MFHWFFPLEYTSSPITGYPISDKCTLIWCVLPVSIFISSNVQLYFGNLSITLKCVIASFPFLFTAIFFLSFVLLPIGMFIVAWFSLTIPFTNAIYVFSTSCFFICSLIFTWAISFFATISTPDVSLSNLCTIPGLNSPPIPDKVPLQIAIIAFTNVPSGFPFAGWTTSPFGLFTTIMSLSS